MEMEECIKTLKKAYQTEHDYLSLDVLYPKYATLPAVTTIYEYFITGRCSELSGPNGAYNLYESEGRANMIIDKLDNIAEKLDEIKANQYALYRAVESANSQLYTLNDETQKVTRELHK